MPAQQSARETDRETALETAQERALGRPDRRTLVRGLAVGGVALPLLAACGGGSGSDGSGDANDRASSSGGSRAATVAAADVPVGGGKVLVNDKVVVTQPTQGEFKAFSAVCTHQGCLVDKVTNGTIQCPCHGSRFAITDGAPVNGPARSPLAGKKVAVSGGQVSVT